MARLLIVTDGADPFRGISCLESASETHSQPVASHCHSANLAWFRADREGWLDSIYANHCELNTYDSQPPDKNARALILNRGAAARIQGCDGERRDWCAHVPSPVNGGRRQFGSEDNHAFAA